MTDWRDLVEWRTLDADTTYAIACALLRERDEARAFAGTWLNQRQTVQAERDELLTKLESTNRMRDVFEYLNNPQVLRAIQRPLRLKLLELMHGPGIRVTECEWSYDNTSDHYETSCGKAWCFMDGCVADNGVKFCPFCGGTIIERLEVNK